MTKKKQTLRQQMRAQAEIRLDELIDVGLAALVKALGPVSVAPLDVMRLACSSQTKTLRSQLVTKLTNAAEAELVKLFNSQQDLELGDDNDKP